MTGLYIHIPFCLSRCHYCDFVITTRRFSDAHGFFLEALEKEIDHYKADFEKMIFDTLYLGGGTPSVLEIEETNRLTDLLRKGFNFKEDAEVTCEVNPGDVDAVKASNYLRLGVNRISLGAQSFQDATLRRLNRRHKAQAIFDSFQILRRTGFKNISLDLMLSLPGETSADVQDSLNQLLALGPEHVSLYELTIEDRTAFGALYKKGKLDLPDEAVQIQILRLARETLKEHGYDHYELLSYARPGFESRHNRIYWANQEYLGLGPGAFSYINGKRFRNSASYEQYLEKIAGGDWSAFEEERLSAEKKEIESFLLALRLKEGASLERFRSLAGQFRNSLDSLEEKGWIEREVDRIRLTAQGQFFAETVFSELSGV